MFSTGPPPPGVWTHRDGRSYRIHMPHDTTVKAACEDVGCEQHRNGWDTVCDLTTPDGRMVAEMIRSGKSGRTYREIDPTARMVIFRFDSGQRCFAEHRTRPGFLQVYSGGRPAREHVSLGDLAEDYMEHTGQLAEQQKRG